MAKRCGWIEEKGITRSVDEEKTRRHLMHGVPFTPHKSLFSVCQDAAHTHSQSETHT